MFKRIISSVIGIPLLIIILLKGGGYIYMSTMLITLVGLREFYNAMKFKKHSLTSFIGYAYTILILTVFHFRLDPIYFLGLIASFIVIINAMQLGTSEYNINEGSLAIYGVQYVAVLLGHIILTAGLPNDKAVWLIFIIAWSTDTFAYFGGFLWGNKKLCPKISPKKTIEGAISGIIGSMLVCAIFSYIFFANYILIFALLGAVGSVVSQVGDLAASQIKRQVGIKDYGNLIPGHGGILDRFDSVIFTAPVVYYFFILFIKL